MVLSVILFLIYSNYNSAFVCYLDERHTLLMLNVIIHPHPDKYKMQTVAHFPICMIYKK